VQRNGSTCRESTLLLDVWLVTHLTGRLLDDALRPLGITGDEFGLYSLLHGRGPVAPTQISRWTGMAPTTVSGMIRRLAARGHLTRRPHPGDARSHLLELTPAARQVTEEAAQVLARLLPRIEDGLPSGAGAVRAGLGALDSALRDLLPVDRHPFPGMADPGETRPATAGEPAALLTPNQQREVQAYAQWLRVRDAEPRA